MAFIHIPKTAGTFIDQYLQKYVLNGYKIFHPWNFNIDRDWTKEELMYFLLRHEENKYVHNHLEGWSEAVFYEYKKQGWLTFSFLRHPGDRLCSLYFYLKKKMPGDTHGLSLNEYLLWRADYNMVPSFYNDINYFAVFDSNSFAHFLKIFFNKHPFPFQKVNQSDNQGYEFYCSQGLISIKAQNAITNSSSYKVYEKLIAQPIVNY